MLAWLRLAVIPLTLLSLFIFPWQLTAFGMLASGFVFPPAPFFIGILADLLYYPGHGWALATIFGAAASLAAYAVRRFAKVYMM